MLVLYWILEELVHNSKELSAIVSKKEIPNAIELKLHNEDSEVYLIDVLTWMNKNYGSCMYEFYAVKSEVAIDHGHIELKLILLPAPSSLVPVRKDRISRLVLLPCQTPPIVPDHQLFSFADSSRRKLYSKENYRASAHLAQAIFEEHYFTATENLQHSKEKGRKEINRNSSHSPKKGHPSGFGHNSTSESNNVKNVNNDIGLPNLMGDDTATAIAEAAGAVGRSLFNFATLSMKTMSDIAEVVNQNTSKLLAINAVVQVGNTKICIIKQIAEGAFGVVFLAQSAPESTAESSSTTSFALKQLICQTKEQVQDAHHELEALQKCRGHPHIIPLLDHSSTSNHNHNNSSKYHREVLMLFPLCPRGTVWDILMRADAPVSDSTIPWPFDEKKLLYITSCIAQALQFMHEKGMSHRDVKPHNILLADPSSLRLPPSFHHPHQQEQEEFYRSVGHPLLMDLGSVTSTRWEVTSKAQALDIEEEAASKTSAAYRAPELTSVPYPTCSIDERVDTWALGCTLYCMAFGRSPFETPKEGVLRLAILNGRYQIPKGRKMRNCLYSEPLEAILLQRMLQVDHQQRPFMGEIVNICDEIINKS